MGFLSLFRSDPVPGAVWISKYKSTIFEVEGILEFVKIESVKKDWVLYSGLEDGQTMSVPEFHKNYTKTKLVFKDPVMHEMWCFRHMEEDPNPFKCESRRCTITKVTSDKVTCDDGRNKASSIYTTTFMKFHNIYCRPKIDAKILEYSERPDPFRKRLKQ